MQSNERPRLQKYLRQERIDCLMYNIVIKEGLNIQGIEVINVQRLILERILSKISHLISIKVKKTGDMQSQQISRSSSANRKTEGNYHAWTVI